MGRILRKKQPSLKKKKKLDTGNSGAGEGTAAGSGAARVSDTALEAKPKPVAALKKAYSQAGPASTAPPADNFFTRSIQYLREVKIELKKVTWPSRKQTFGTTLVVLVLVMLISVFLSVVDMGLSGLVRTIFN
jgi:preprotein translocase subunit SecE